jgi:hypothetical protein
MTEVLALQILESETTEGNGPAWCSIFSLGCTITTN